MTIQNRRSFTEGVILARWHRKPAHGNGYESTAFLALQPHPGLLSPPFLVRPAAETENSGATGAGSRGLHCGRARLAIGTVCAPAMTRLTRTTSG